MNYTLVKQVASLERQCWRNALYSRRESVEITGMSNLIVHRVLQKTVQTFATYWSWYWSWYWSGETRIVPPPQQNSEISRTKDSEQVIKVKKGLNDLNPTDSDFPEGTRLFINDKLSPYYRVLWNKYKKLWINK